MIQTIRVYTTKGPDLTGDGLLHDVRHSLKGSGISKVQSAKVYRLEGVTEKQARMLTEVAFSESINQTYTLNKNPDRNATYTIEIAYKPGVMNPEVESILKSARDLGITLTAADSSRAFLFYGTSSKKDIGRLIAELNLYNPLIEHIVTQEPKALRLAGKVGRTRTVPIRTMSDTALMDLSRDALFLNLKEMRVIQHHFVTLKRDPTDCELEVLAQTWSEHCVHKTFKADLTIDGKKKKPLFSRIKETASGHEKRIVSAFSDNSGVIDFYDGYGICGKVETHNSPSAIEPYGGAMTGSGGVFRDVLGTGKGAKVLASTDIFCFAPPDLPERDIPQGCLPPLYLLKKVVQGVRDYGNRVGIPTNNGSVHFHRDFRAKPTVAVGAYGLIPKNQAKKQSPKIGDLIVTIGGRTGRDGIHGATFSSGEMTDRTMSVSGAAVQIGNAIEEKRVIDAVQVLRDKGFIRAITDCGAGGYSSAIGEMGEKIGATVQLESVPLKYPGLAPWEIFLSESQERMVLAIAPKDKKSVLTVLTLFNVEGTVIGTFDGSKRLRVLYEKSVICDLPMDFLHNGLPKRHMTGKTTHKKPQEKFPREPKNYEEAWGKIMSHGNVNSKEPILRLYDHTVQGRAALQPLGGVDMDAPNDGAIVKPFHDKPYGMIIAHGLNPALNSIDPYHGSVWAITEAVSNYVAIGGDLKDAALIDNFIWPFPDEASLADLDKAVDACVEMARLLNMPFVSGKDSLSSTYRFKNGDVLKIPPVLLISVFGKIPDVTKSATSDFKKAGSTIVFLGRQDTEGMGGSTYFDTAHYRSGKVPGVDLKTLPRVLSAITNAIQKGELLSCHDVSEGGIAAAIAEMSFGGGFGAEIDLSHISRSRPDFIFFNETAGTFFVEVADEKTAKRLFNDVPHSIIGKTVSNPTIRVLYGKERVAESTLARLKKAWQRPMKEIFA